jgi:hypothetical protein
MPTARAETVLSLNRQMRRILATWSTAFPCFARCSRPLQLVDLVAWQANVLMNELFLYAFLG